MSNQRDDLWSRREFLTTAALAGTGALFGLRSDVRAAEPPPETTRIRLVATFPSICRAPQYLAEEFLLGEGFTDVQYIKVRDSEGGLTASWRQGRLISPCSLSGRPSSR
jgi:hypothetical protein